LWEIHGHYDGEGLYQRISPEGEKMVTLYGTDATTGWSVRVGIPDEIFRAPLVRSMWPIAGGVAISLALAAAFLWLPSREVRLRRRAEEAAEQSRRLDALGRTTIAWRRPRLPDHTAAALHRTSRKP